MSCSARIGIVTDGASNLPEEYAKEHHIEIVKFPVWFPGEDTEVEDTQTLYRRMRQIEKTAKTSAPPPSRFKKAYKKSLQRFDEVLAVLLFKGWSGTFDSAILAREQMSTSEQQRIVCFDTHLAAVAQALMVYKAQELADEGKKLSEITKQLERYRESIRLFAFIEDLVWLIRGGRLREPRASAALTMQKAGIRPAIGIVNGEIKMTGLKLTGKDYVGAILKELKKLSRKGRLKVALSHGDLASDSLTRLDQGLAELDVELMFTAQLTPLIGSHTGPGTIMVAYHY